MLESVVLYRLMVHETLSVPLLPTLGIQIAPALVGCVALLGLTTGGPDRLAFALLGYGLLQGIVLVRLALRLRAQRFAPSYWAFTFGVTALALAPLRMTARGADDLGSLALGLFLVANLVVGSIAVGTVVLAVRGRLLLSAESAAASRTLTNRPSTSGSGVRRPIAGRVRATAASGFADTTQPNDRSGRRDRLPALAIADVVRPATLPSHGPVS
jgi:hypothetical protein